jgi:hypothetical protein
MWRIDVKERLLKSGFLVSKSKGSGVHLLNIIEISGRPAQKREMSKSEGYLKQPSF